MKNQKILTAMAVIAAMIILGIMSYVNYRNSDAYEIKNNQPEKYQSLIERIQKAESQLSDSQGDDQKQDVLIRMGTYYEELGDYSKAISYYKKAIKINEVHIIPWTNMASIYKKQGRYGKAEEIYKKIITMFPKDTQSYHNLIDLYTKYNIGNREELLKIIREGVAQTGDNALSAFLDSLSKSE